MATLATSPGRAASASTQPLWQSRWLWCWLALALVLLRGWASGDIAAVWRGYGDTDDATRLVQVRTWMAGAGWHDLLLERFGGQTPLISHWSRLIDVPLALLLGGLGQVVSAESAELIVRLAWPAVLLVVLFRVLAAAAEHEGGPVAAGAAIALTATMLTGLFRFAPGRIDHHNVMIIATVGGLLLLLRALQRPQLGYGAGACLGLALVVGYEPIALIVPLLALLVVAAAIEPHLLRPARNTVAAVAAVLTAGLAVTHPPSLWLRPACDAIGLNVAAAAWIGAAGLWLLDRYGQNRAIMLRFGALAVSGIIALVAFAAFAPACLAGPFAGVSDAAKRLWLDHVQETFALQAVWNVAPDNAILIVATIAIAMTTAILRYIKQPTEIRAALIAMLIVSASAALVSYKLYPYFSFVAAYANALWIADLTGSGSMPARSQRLAALLALNQSTAAVVLVPLVLAASGWMVPVALQPAAEADRKAALSHGACYDFATVRPLAKLPKGLIVAHTDLGPFIVASTPHDVLAAPYHRIDRAIVLNNDILTASPESADALLRRVGADYVATCGSEIPPGPGKTTTAGLAQSLQRNERVPFLEEIKLAPSVPLRIWRVLR
jgi:hypothetical protein